MKVCDDLSKVDNLVKPMVGKIPEVCNKIQTKDLSEILKKKPDEQENQKLPISESLCEGQINSPFNPHIDLKHEPNIRFMRVQGCEFGVWDRGKVEMFSRAEFALGELLVEFTEFEELAWEEKDSDNLDTGEFCGGINVDSAFNAAA